MKTPAPMSHRFSFVFIRVHSWLNIFVTALLLLSPATAEVMDRVAVAVGNRAIKESQLDRDIRLTAFLNGTALDFGGASKRKAADRLIDQTMIRAEMAKASSAAPAKAEIDQVLEKIKQARFRGNPEYEQALKTYGITEPELKSHVAWQIQVLHFAGQRFGDRVNTAFFAWLDTSRKSSRIQFHDEVF
jgi:parvulin-like peptidyl-prolyl isomerase